MLEVLGDENGYHFIIFGHSNGRRGAEIASAWFPAFLSVHGMNPAAAAAAAYAAGKAWAALYGVE